MIDLDSHKQRLIAARAALLEKMHNGRAKDGDHSLLCAIEAELSQIESRPRGKR